MIQLSKAAASEVKRLQSKSPQLNVYFRLGIQESGCCGLSYTMQFDQINRPEDQLWESEGIQIAVNSSFLPYLDGLTIDYSEDLMGGGFRFNNPNAAESCSCSNSFAVKQ